MTNNEFSKKIESLKNEKHFDKFIITIINDFSDPRLNHEQRYLLNSVFNFRIQFDFEDKKIIEEINKLLDFSNPVNFSKTDTLLGLLTSAHFSFLDTNILNSPDRADLIEKIIKEKLAIGSGSFILNLRAKQLLVEMKNWVDDDYLDPSEEDRIASSFNPFEHLDYEKRVIQAEEDEKKD